MEEHCEDSLTVPKGSLYWCKERAPGPTMIKNAWIDPAAKLESIEVHSVLVGCSSISAPCTWDETELLQRCASSAHASKERSVCTTKEVKPSRTERTQALGPPLKRKGPNEAAKARE